LPKIHEQLSQAELLPDKHLVDAGYIEASNLVESQREYDIDMIGPAQSNGRWQQVQGNGFDFSLCFAKTRFTCIFNNFACLFQSLRDMTISARAANELKYCELAGNYNSSFDE
jgi:hypothetical protein